MGILASVICGAIGAAIGGALGGPGGAVAGGCIGAGVGGGIGKEDEQPPEFIVNPKRTKFTPEGSTEAIDVFEVQVKGAIFAQKAKTTVDFMLLLRDCTGGKEFKDGDVVATSEEGLSSIGDGVLSPIYTDTLPYEETEYKEWVTLFVVPVDSCIFPYRGSRDIEFAVLVQDKKENALAFGTKKISVQLNKIGYVDYGNLQEKSEKTALKIIHVIVFNNASYFTLDTSRIITDWIKLRSELRDDASEKMKVQRSLTSVFSKMKNSTSAAPVSSIVSLVRDLSENVRTADKYIYMEFFLSVVATFENISADDLKLLDLIAQEMRLDAQEYQEAKHKYLPMHEVDESDPFVILGISNTLSIQEKQRKLCELFAKWNSLTTHNDPEMRRKAEMMVNTIAECRKNISLR